MKNTKAANRKTVNTRTGNARTAIAGTLGAKSPHARANAESTWKQFEDHLVPRLRLSVIDRAVYSHLLRHSRLEGKREVRFSIRELARRVRISGVPVRDAVRRLIAYGVLRLVERTNAGHLVEVRLPQEIRAVRTAGLEPGASPIRQRFRIEQTDFLKSRELRRAIHARERGLCFYCMRRFRPAVMCLDHVIPRVRSGRNSYRNLVSCCTGCNAQKGPRSASDFLCKLYREQRLTASELRGRLSALEALAGGKLLPPLPPSDA
jgi:predicted DNA-binding transcriptional regulator